MVLFHTLDQVAQGSRPPGARAHGRTGESGPPLPPAPANSLAVQFILQVSVLREPREAIYAPRSAALSPQFACSTRDGFRVEWIRKCDDIVMERVVSSARLRLDESP